eukprot:868239-Rhodomonas_salina.1
MQHNYAFRASVLSPEPKTQHESRSRADVQDWIDAEFIEMDTIYHMGTIVYVRNEDLPEGDQEERKTGSTRRPPEGTRVH